MSAFSPENRMQRIPKPSLRWQSKTILLIVVPWTAADTLLETHWWATQIPVVMWITVGISSLLGLVVWRLRAGTVGASAAGAAITASLMYSTSGYPYKTSWAHGGLLPLLAMFALTFAATKIGRLRAKDENTSLYEVRAADAVEDKRGRTISQVAANLGVAALVTQPFWFSLLGWVSVDGGGLLASTAAVAALAEAAADTVSSEIGRAYGGRPRLISSLRHVEPGTDGGVTLLGSAAGVVAAVLVAGVGSWAILGSSSFSFRGSSWLMFVVAAGGGVFGMFFDSLLGAELERRGWLNNDAVNFLSTLSAAAFALSAMVMLVYLRLRG